MIERDVFLEYHHDMFDRRRGADVMPIIEIAAVPIVGDGGCRRDHQGQSGYKT